MKFNKKKEGMDGVINVEKKLIIIVKELKFLYVHTYVNFNIKSVNIKQFN